MVNKTVHSKAAGILRQAVRSQAPIAKPGEETKPVEPATPVEPAATT